MKLLSTTVTPTTAYLGDTITLASEVSETISSSHLAMWIIDFDATIDPSTPIWQLMAQDRVLYYEWASFSSKTDMKSEVQIDEDMLNIHTLTFILSQNSSTGSSISENPEDFTIGDNISVSFKMHLYDKVKKLGNQWFYLKDEINTLLSAKENNANKVTSLSSLSTDTQYPSAKAVYDATFNLDTLDCINENFTLLSLPQPIIFTYNEDSIDGTQAELFASRLLIRYTKGAYVDWGDGTPIEIHESSTLEHVYSDNVQEHTIIIYGEINQGYLGLGSFQDLTGLTSINIPSTVIKIGHNSFSRCTGLTSINLPKELADIGLNVFQDCINLNTIILNWTDSVPIDYTRLMYGSPSTISPTFSIPYGTTSLYENAGYPTAKLVERSE